MGGRAEAGKDWVPGICAAKAYPTPDATYSVSLILAPTQRVLAAIEACFHLSDGLEKWKTGRFIPSCEDIAFHLQQQALIGLAPSLAPQKRH